MGSLSGRVALVTGAAAGLGRGIALAYAAEGADVAVVDRNADGAERVARAVEASGRRAVGIAADVGDEDAVGDAFARARAALGPVDVLVNNAGICTVAHLDGMPSAVWHEMLRVNLSGVFFCTRAALPDMTARRWGRIVNISSQLAHKGGEGMAHYAAAKAGILGLTRSLAHEVTHLGIVVNAICPGPIEDTDMRLPRDWAARKQGELLLGRQGRVAEVVPTAVLLAGEAASFYVGATFNPNGGDIMV